MTQQRVLEDVLAFSEVGLGVSLYDWQHKMVAAVDRCGTLSRVKLALAAPNGAGKSERVVAVSILRWLNRWPRGRVILTSADAKQIDSQIMPALKAHQGKFPGWEFLGRSIRTHDNGFLLAFTTDESSRCEGHHANRFSPLLVVIDESKSVDNAIFQAFDRCTFNVELLISSPGLKQGRFYDAFTAHREQFLLTLQVGLKDCPHIPRERIQDVVATYGEASPFTRSTLYGEFMDEDSSQPMAVKYQGLIDLLDSPPGARISRDQTSAFVDFAAGGDENVIAVRSGNKLIDLVAWRDRDTVAAVGRCIIEFRRLGLRPEQVWGDAGGLGHPMCDMLRDAGWGINRFDFGGKAYNEKVYFNRGMEIWANLSKSIEKREVVLINDPALVNQLTTRKVFYDMKGRVRLESKDDLRARGLKSPDRADAVAGAFAHGNMGYTMYQRKIRSPWDAAELWWEQEEKVRSNSADDDEMAQLQKDMGAFAGY